MVTFSLPKESWWPVDLRCLLSGRSGLQFALDKVDYLEEANRQLMDERFYKKLDSDPTEEFSTKITQELKIMKENSHIDKNTFD
jgi:hypothetical protein